MPDEDTLGIAPLMGNTFTDDARWLGSALAHHLSEHILAADVAKLLSPNAVSQRMVQKGFTLPLERETAEELRTELGLRALIYGDYTLDESSNSLGIRLQFAAPGVSKAPLEAAAPLSSFGRYVERSSLAVMTRLGYDITVEVRERVSGVYRPAGFEAFHQLARARMAWANNEPELSLAAVEAALALDPTYEEAVAVQIAVARQAGDTNTVVDAFSKWVDFARKRKDFPLAVERQILLGHWMIERTEWGEARRAFREAADIARRTQNEQGEALAKNNIAALDITVANPGPAIAVMRRSLRTLIDAEADPQNIAETYFNLALAHKQQGQREEAIRALESAMPLARDTGDTALQARIVAQRGTIRDDMGVWAEAMADYARAANLFDTLGHSIERAMVRAHQALLYRRQGMYDRAQKIYEESLAVFEKDPNPPMHDLAVLHLNMADLYYAMDRFEEAWDYATRAVDVLRELESGFVGLAESLIAELEEEDTEENRSDNEPPQTAN